MDVDQDIEVHIERLVLHGFAPEDRTRISNAIKEQLIEMFSTQGVSNFLSKGGEVPKVDAGTFLTAPAATPPMVGNEVARSIYNSLR